MDEKNYEKLRLRRQWLIDKNRPPQAIIWKTLPLCNDFYLFYHQDLKVEYCKTEKKIVVILGIAINPYNIHENLITKIAKTNDITETTDEIKKIGGTYVIIIANAQNIVIFNDPSGMMGVYFDSKSRASSTPSLLQPIKRNSTIEKDFQFGPGNDWYTGSFTAYEGVKKLIPNCLLELFAGSIHRYWPKKFDIPIEKNNITENRLNAICTLLTDMINGVVEKGKVIGSITGGKDSRVVLAASKINWPKISYFTLHGKAVQNEDIKYAKLLAQQAHLDHIIYEIGPVSQKIDALYNEIGANEAIGARREIATTCLQLEGKDTIHLNGNLGAICKSYYWQSAAPKIFKINAVMRDFLRPGTTTKEGITYWRETLSDIDNATILYNLFYLEQRGGRWIAAGENCSRLFYETFTPFNHRDIFSHICCLPLELQRSGTLLKLLVKNMAPELLDVPYCTARRNWTKYIPEYLKSRIRHLVKN